MKQNVDIRRVSGVLRQGEYQNSPVHQNTPATLLFAFFHFHWKISQTSFLACTLSNKTAAASHPQMMNTQNNVRVLLAGTSCATQTS